MGISSWRGCRNIKMEWYNTQADPSIVYKGYRFNYWDIEDALWSNFLEDTGHDDSESGCESVEKEFDEYVQSYAEYYLADVMFGGYFADGSKDWRDNY